MKITKVKISELKQAEYNPRRLTKKQYEDLKASLEKFGLVDPTGHKNQIENLIALCRSCHIKAETNKEFNQQLKEQNIVKHNCKYL